MHFGNCCEQIGAVDDVTLSVTYFDDCQDCLCRFVVVLTLTNPFWLQ